jgi:hypothetical protein
MVRGSLVTAFAPLQCRDDKSQGRIPAICGVTTGGSTAPAPFGFFAFKSFAMPKPARDESRQETERITQKTQRTAKSRKEDNSEPIPLSLRAQRSNLSVPTDGDCFAPLAMTEMAKPA